MKHLKIFALLVLVPLVIAAFGGWQYDRASTQILDLEALGSILTQAVPELKELAGTQPTAIVSLGGERVGVQVALSRVEKASAELSTALPLARVSLALATAVLGLGLLAAVTGLSALLATLAAGKIARRSREDLLRVFSLGRRLLPFVLVSHVAMIAAAVAAVLAYEAVALWHIGRLSQGEIKLMVAALFITLACLWTIWQLVGQLKAMRSMFESSPMEVLGLPVTPDEAPALWAHVRALAGELKALPPEHIVVGMTEGFYVTAHDVLAMPSATVLKGRTLHVPMLCLGLFNRDETSAVIGHELAHFAGADTDYSIRFLPIYDTVSRSLIVLAQAIGSGDLLQRSIMRPAFMFGQYFMERFDDSVNHWSRERELIADAAGAQVAGSIAAGSALVRLSSSMPGAEKSLAAQLDDAAQAPDDMITPMLDALSREALSMPPDLLAEHLPHPSDSHPTTISRIATLDVALDTAVDVGTRPVDSAGALARLDTWFVDAASLRRRLGSDLKARVLANEAETVQILHTHATAVQGECHLHEGTRVRGIVVCVMSVIFLAAGLFICSLPYWAPSTQSSGSKLFLLGGACLIVAALMLLARGWLFITNADKTALTMTPDAVRFFNSIAPVPFAHMADVGLSVGNGVLITFELRPDAPAPQLSKRRMGMPCARWHKKRRLLQLRMTQACVNGKALKADALMALVLDYFNAGQARMILQERA